MAGYPRICLYKRLENSIFFVGAYAYSRVGNLEKYYTAFAFCFFCRRKYAYAALMREFNCVADKIGKNLPKLHRIANQHFGNFLIYINRK